MWLFLAVPWVGMQCVVVVFPDNALYFLEAMEFYEIGLKQILEADFLWNSMKPV